MIRPKGQIKTRGLHVYDLLGKGAHLKLQNAKRNQIHQNAGSVGGDANAVLALAYRRHGNGCKAITKILGYKHWENVAQIFKSLDLGALPMEERKNMPTLTEEERAQRIYEDLWMREVRSVRKNRTWAMHPDSLKHFASKRYYEMNPDRPVFMTEEEKAQARREYARKKRKKPINRIKENIRKRVRNKLRGNSMTTWATGCTTAELKAWLESQFKGSMAWSNYGTVWHVDHIRPIASFDLTNKDEAKAANHYTNLQPMLAKENMQKSDQWNGQQEFAHELL